MTSDEFHDALYRERLCREAVENENRRLRDLADEYNRLMRHMDAGGDFFAFQTAEAARRNAPAPNT